MFYPSYHLMYKQTGIKKWLDPNKLPLTSNQLQLHKIISLLLIRIMWYLLFLNIPSFNICNKNNYGLVKPTINFYSTDTHTRICCGVQVVVMIYILIVIDYQTYFQTANKLNVLHVTLTLILSL